MASWLLNYSSAFPRVSWVSCSNFGFSSQGCKTPRGSVSGTPRFGGPAAPGRGTNVPPWRAWRGPATDHSHEPHTPFFRPRLVAAFVRRSHCTSGGGVAYLFRNGWARDEGHLSRDVRFRQWQVEPCRARRRDQCPGVSRIASGRRKTVRRRQFFRRSRGGSVSHCQGRRARVNQYVAYG